MKYLFSFILLVFLCGCANTETKVVSEDTRTVATDSTLQLKGHIGGHMIREFEYDGCQYIAFGTGNSFTVTHKGNCKYCQQRNK